MSVQKQSRATVIQAVKTPIGLLALLVLVAEGVLIAVAAAAGEGIQLWLVAAALLIIFMTIGAFLYVVKTSPELFRPLTSTGVEKGRARAQTVEPSIDVFFSAPMAAHKSDAAYERSRDQVMKLVKALNDFAGMTKIFYAGELLKTAKDFDQEIMAIQDDFRLIDSCRTFLLYYPESLPSGALVECGYAMALDKPIAIITRKKRILPFMLRDAGQVFDNIQIYESPNKKK